MDYESTTDSSDSSDTAYRVVAEEPTAVLESSSVSSSDGEDASGNEVKDPAIMSARAYQLEMLEASLKENIICAMDTGSGKTQVAILRIRAELERMATERLVWFLAPTVSLCEQQFQVLKLQIPSVQPKIITGSDNLESWSEATWQGALVNVQIVVTTPQVLLDALLHGFVRISSIALLVFDEAHHCNKKHAYSRIMKEFYWEAKGQDFHVPHILGLTASPVIRSNVSTVQQLESTLDSVCRSPTRHRDELLAHSHRPSLISITYELQTLSKPEYTEAMSKIHLARETAKKNIMDDPYVMHLRTQNGPRSEEKLKQAIMQHKTYVQSHLKRLCTRSVEMGTELGTWAADWYLYEAIRRFLDGFIRQGASSESYMDSEVVYLARILQTAEIGPPAHLWENSDLSNKIRCLIDILLKYEGDARGIVFVKERATTVLVAHILATHPELSKRYRVGKIVGSSFVPGFRKDFIDLPETDGPLSLEAFRSGKKNLLVATSVLEEGIDVPACNIVICVDIPATLKSFIQRRGRARMSGSHFYLLTNKEAQAKIKSTRDWETLEAEMKRYYEDELREAQKLQVLEDSEAPDYPELRVETTGARLTINDAKSHLQHFCATLASRRYVNYHPDYIVEQIGVIPQLGASGLRKATVVLPISVPQSVRQAKSSRAWVSEKNACMDAAFQAYKALYEIGLLDDHLLPLQDKLERELEIRPGLVEARAQFNPWYDIASAWDRDTVQLRRRKLTVFEDNGSIKCEVEIAIPGTIPEMKPMVVWWDHHTRLTLSLDSDTVMADDPENDAIVSDQDCTHVLLALAYMHRRMTIKENCVLRIFSPSALVTKDRLGNTPFSPNLVAAKGLGFLVRDERDEQRHPYYFDSFLPSKPQAELFKKVYKGFDEDPEDAPYLAVKKWPRKTGFFHQPLPPVQSSSTIKPYSRVIPASSTTVDSIPLVYAQFGLLIPSLIYYMELYLLATELSSTLLAPLGLTDITRVVEAICASSARAPMNYERVEFLGDSILKTCVTLNVAATNIRLPEGLLSLLKDRLVSNARLYRAARDSGLDQFIVTQQLALKGWHPPYVSELLDAGNQLQKDAKRTISTKTLADVVEAIIGVAYIDGGIPKALQAISLFLGESQTKSLAAVRGVLFSAAEPKGMVLSTAFQPLEELLGYTFHEKALLVEAMTHPSYNVGGTVAGFDRLEFIGDAILDFIVVEELYAVVSTTTTDPGADHDQSKPLENWQMHLLRTALVNADILAFLVMEWSCQQLRIDVHFSSGSPNSTSDDSSSDSIHSNNFDTPTITTKENGFGNKSANQPQLTRTEISLPLWSFMRQSSTELILEREATQARHAALRGPILQAMETGTHYPWALLARLHAQKFYSDLYEALLGAIWVDSGPEFGGACRNFVENSGVLPYLRRLLRDEVHVLHPKEELGRLADRERVEYVVTEMEGEKGEGREWACEVKIGGRPVVCVGNCLFKEEAKVTAATRACEILKGGHMKN